QFEGPDVGRVIDVGDVGVINGAEKRGAALIVGRSADVAPGVDSGAACQERMGRSGTAVVGQGPQQWIERRDGRSLLVGGAADEAARSDQVMIAGETAEQVVRRTGW